MELNEIKAKLVDYIQSCNLDCASAISVYDFDNCYSTQELIIKMVTKINEIVTNTNDYTLLVTKILDWVSNEGLSDSVNGVLGEWLKNGTLGSVINKDLLGEVNKEVDNNKKEINDLKCFNTDVESLLFTGFNGVNGTQLDYYYSNDGINLHPINFNSLLKNSISNAPIRDISPLFFKGKLYLCYVTKKDNKECIGISNTTDLINYKTNYVFFDDNVTSVYAPYFYEDNGKVFITVPLQFNNAMVGNFKDMRIHFIQSLDDNLTIWSSPIRVNYDSEFSMIDGILYKDNENHKLYSFVKDEVNGIIKQYVNNTDDITSNTFTFVQDIDFSNGFGTSESEGPTICKFKNTYYLYCDKYAEEKSGVVTSTDLINWSISTEVKNDFNIRTKHIAPININNELSIMLNKFLVLNSVNDVFSLNKKVFSNYDYITDISKYINKGIFTPVIDKNKVLYYCSSNVVINAIKTDTYSNGYFVGENTYNINNLDLLVFNSGSIIFNQVEQTEPYLKSVLTGANTKYIVNKDFGNTEFIFSLVRCGYHDKFYRIKSDISINALVDTTQFENVNLLKSSPSSIIVNSTDYNLITQYSYRKTINKPCVIEYEGSMKIRNSGEQSEITLIPVIKYRDDIFNINNEYFFEIGTNALSTTLSFKRCFNHVDLNKEIEFLIYAKVSNGSVNLTRFNANIKITNFAKNVVISKFDNESFN